MHNRQSFWYVCVVNCLQAGVLLFLGAADCVRRAWKVLRKSALRVKKKYHIESSYNEG